MTHTKEKWKLAIGEHTCFHEGNRVSIYCESKDGEEIVTSTIAEVWSTCDDTDIADGKLIVSSRDMYEILKQILENQEAGHDVNDWEQLMLDTQQVINKIEGE